MSLTVVRPPKPKSSNFVHSLQKPIYTPTFQILNTPKISFYYNWWLTAPHNTINFTVKEMTSLTLSIQQTYFSIMPKKIRMPWDHTYFHHLFFFSLEVANHKPRRQHQPPLWITINNEATHSLMSRAYLFDHVCLRLLSFDVQSYLVNKLLLVLFQDLIVFSLWSPSIFHRSKWLYSSLKSFLKTLFGV